MPGTNIYKVVNKKPILIGYIKSNEEINKETLAEIRKEYSLEEELKILRRQAVDKDAFQAYNDYVEECRAKGQQKKEEAATKLASLKQAEITEGEEKRMIYVEE